MCMDFPYLQKAIRMRNYKLTVKVPESYRKHISLLQRRMKMDSKDEVIKELIDKELFSLFTPENDNTIMSS